MMHAFYELPREDSADEEPVVDGKPLGYTEKGKDTGFPRCRTALRFVYSSHAGPKPTASPSDE